MSYCRFSSDNWRCDVYVYERSGGGWATHVAGNRHIVPPIPDIVNGALDTALYRWSGVMFAGDIKKAVYPIRWRWAVCRAWLSFVVLWRNRVHLASVRAIPRRNIGLPHDCETIYTTTAAECAELLESLKAMGYRVPQYAINALREEA